MRSCGALFQFLDDVIQMFCCDLNKKYVWTDNIGKIKAMLSAWVGAEAK